MKTLRAYWQIVCDLWPWGYRPTARWRDEVRILAGARWRLDDIADHLGVTIQQLERHFADELASGPVKLRADIIQAMFHAAKKGDVAAAKILLLIMTPTGNCQNHERKTNP